MADNETRRPEVVSGKARSGGTIDNQSKRLDTDSSVAVREIASPIRSAMETTRIFCASTTACVGWMESVITNS